jgi:hypothetical protein
MNYKYNVILLSALWEEVSQFIVQIKETQLQTMTGWKTALNFECKINDEIKELSVIRDEVVLNDFVIKMKLYEIRHWFIELLAKDSKDKALAVSHVKFLKVDDKSE